VSEAPLTQNQPFIVRITMLTSDKPAETIAGGRRRRGRPITIGAASVAATGILAGTLIAGCGSTAPPRSARAATQVTRTPPPSAVAPAPSATVANVGMPRYYIVDSNPKLAALPVRSSLTGKVVSTVSPPAACDPKMVKVAAAGNNQDFVLGCVTAQKISFYRFQVSSNGLASALTPLSAQVSGGFLNDIALNADGTKLAIGLQNPNVLEVVTLATGATRTWTGGSPFDLTWADHGRELGYFGNAGLYVLNVNGSGRDLHSARLILSRLFKAYDVEEAELSPDGTTVIAAVNYNNLSAHLNRNSVVGGIIKISATTQEPLATLLAEHAQYSLDGGGSEAGWYVTNCALGGLDATGHHLLVSCDRFGRLDRGRFTPIPGPGPQQALYTAAW
jgi:hypothetical protein